jgi:putative ABC transport system permease protein
MKYLPFVLKHLRQNWVRTGSTVLAMGLCIFLFCTLETVLAQINEKLESAKATRLMVRNAVSFAVDLPLAQGAQIRSVQGVKRVAALAWFRGSLPTKKEGKADEGSPSTTDWTSFVPGVAVEAEPYFAIYPEFQPPPEQFQDFLKDLQGCLIGRKLADKFSWKPGDHLFLESVVPAYRKPSGPFEFVVRAVFDPNAVKYPAANAGVLFFHYRYLFEGVGGGIGVGGYAVEVEDPEQAGAVAQAIDALFENSDAQTRTETEQAFRASFISMAGDLALLINGIGLAVTFTILLVTANTMSMAVRERRTEIGVLKTVGFSSGRVMGLIVGEGLLLGVLGGALGVGGSQAVLQALSSVPALRETLAGLGLQGLKLNPGVGTLGFAVSLFLGVAAGFGPSWGAYRAHIAQILRTV